MTTILELDRTILGRLGGGASRFVSRHVGRFRDGLNKSNERRSTSLHAAAIAGEDDAFDLEVEITPKMTIVPKITIRDMRGSRAKAAYRRGIVSVITKEAAETVALRPDGTIRAGRHRVGRFAFLAGVTVRQIRAAKDGVEIVVDAGGTVPFGPGDLGSAAISPAALARIAASLDRCIKVDALTGAFLRRISPEIQTIAVEILQRERDTWVDLSHLEDLPDETIKLMRGDHAISSNIRLSPAGSRDVTWANGVVRLAGTFPETVLMTAAAARPGTPVDSVVAHPWLAGLRIHKTSRRKDWEMPHLKMAALFSDDWDWMPIAAAELPVAA